MRWAARCEGASWRRRKLNILCYKISAIPLATPRSQRLQWLMQGFTYAANGGGGKFPQMKSCSPVPPPPPTAHSLQWCWGGVWGKALQSLLPKRGPTRLHLGKDAWLQGEPSLQLCCSHLDEVGRRGFPLRPPVLSAPFSLALRDLPACGGYFLCSHPLATFLWAVCKLSICLQELGAVDVPREARSLTTRSPSLMSALPC